MELSNFFINPVHVAAIGKVQKSPSSAEFLVFYVGADEPLHLHFASEEEAKSARADLVLAVTHARRA